MTEYCKCKPKLDSAEIFKVASGLLPVKIDDSGKLWCPICNKRVRPPRKAK